MRTTSFGSTRLPALGLATMMVFLNVACSANRCGKSSISDLIDDGNAWGNANGDGDDTGSSGDGNLAIAPGDANSGNEAVRTYLPATYDFGIEESDLVQVRGDRLYVHNQHTGLNVLDMSDPAHPSFVGTNQDVVGKAGELYVRDDSVLVVVSESDCALPGDLGGWFVAERHQLASIDTQGTFATLHSSCLPGHVIGSRLIDSRLYVLSEFSAPGGFSLSWLISLDVSESGETKVVDVESFSGSAHEFHVTGEAIVVAERVPNNEVALNEAPADGMGGSAMGGAHNWTPDEAPKTAPILGTAPEFLATKMRYFGLSPDSGQLTAGGSIVLEGAPQGRFHYDITRGKLRVVTFSGRDVGSHVWVIDLADPDQLVVTGHYPDLAPTEDLHAALFVGERLYVVTYEPIILRTDPLWVFDMSSDQPVLLGHLEIPGFSSHLYPRGGDMLMAIGRGDEGFGVAVSLFDVSSPNNPLELDRLELGQSLTFTEGNMDYRGVNLLHVGGETLLALPLTEQTPDGSSCTQSNSLEFIQVNDASLAHLSTLSLPDRARRTLAMDQNVIAVGDVHVSTFDVKNTQNPFVRSTITVGDPDAPIECIEFTEFLGNSSDAILGGGWDGGDWEDWDGSEGGGWEGDGANESDGCD